jgi:hypothetical protein
LFVPEFGFQAMSVLISSVGISQQTSTMSAQVELRECHGTNDADDIDCAYSKAFDLSPLGSHSSEASQADKPD